jgi:hypothetical protein
MPSLSLVIVASAQAAVKHRGMIKDPYARAATNPARHARGIVTHEVRKVVTNS